MQTTAATAWKPSATLPKSRTSFASISYGEMVGRARALVPQIAARAEECERLRRMPDATERSLHDSGLFRMVQPARIGGADLDVGILVDTCAEVARVCPSTAWNLGNLASHHWTAKHGWQKSGATYAGEPAWLCLLEDLASANVAIRLAHSVWFPFAPQTWLLDQAHWLASHPLELSTMLARKPRLAAQQERCAA